MDSFEVHRGMVTRALPALVGYLPIARLSVSPDALCLKGFTWFKWECHARSDVSAVLVPTTSQARIWFNPGFIIQLRSGDVVPHKFIPNQPDRCVESLMSYGWSVEYA